LQDEHPAENDEDRSRAIVRQKKRAPEKRDRGECEHRVGHDQGAGDDAR